MRKGLDNRGYSMVAVIIAITFISILVATILTVSTVNIQMKTVDRRTKETFYSAEEVLDQINTGLQQEISYAVEIAYADIMKDYNNAAYTSADDRKNAFDKIYFNKLIDQIVNPSVVDNPDIGSVTNYVYNPNDLKNYLDAELQGSTTLSSASNAITYEVVIQSGVTHKSIVLQDLTITYADTNGNMSEIVTDIRVEEPELNLVQPNDMPDIFGLCIIADTKLQSKPGASGTTIINPNIYVGTGGMVLNTGANWNFVQVGRAIVAGDVDVQRLASYKADTDMQLWARNVKVQGGIFNMRGYTYLASDLIMNSSGGTGSTVKLEGEYYGYGNGDGYSIQVNGVPHEITPVGESSAILINGINSQLDMEDVDKLVLCGTAQIATSGMAIGTNTSNNVDLGESLEVKSNQIAYLVPPECVGVVNYNDGTSEVKFGRNPMSYEEYVQLTNYVAPADSTFSIIDYEKEVEGLGKLSTYGTASQTVFVPSPTHNMVYLYVNFGANNAKYFEDYYRSHQDEVNKYMTPYATQIKLSSTGVIDTSAGNVVYKNNAGTYNLKSNVGLPSTFDTDDENTYQERFKALTSKLVLGLDQLDEEDEALSTVFENIVDETKIADAATPYTYSIADPTTGKNIKMVVTGTAPYTYNAASDPNKEVCLILAKGDVLLEQDFAGIVIAKGTVTVDSSTVRDIDSNEEKIHTILRTPQNPANPTSVSLLEYYFQDGAAYMSNIGGGVANNDYIVYEELISYEGWTKQ